MAFGSVLSAGVLNRERVVCGTNPCAMDALATCATTALAAFKNVVNKSFARAAFQKESIHCKRTQTASIHNVIIKQTDVQWKDATVMVG